MIPPRFLDEIRSRLTLSDIIGRRVKTVRAGREFKACCPFHHEKTPSFYINDDKQFYHCFGCGAHGDVVGFVMRNDNLSFIEAVEMLSAEAGLQMPKPDPVEAAKAQKQRDLHSLLEDATKWFEQNLYARGNEKIVEYMLGRGLSRETLERFRVGFAPEDRQAMRSFLKSKSYDDTMMIEAGVLRPAKERGEAYAFFRERVMFPVTDRRGRVVAYGGRILPDHMRAPDRGDYKPAKYMNSGDTPLFDKGRMLYAEALARQAAGDGSNVIVTEGYMDVIAAHQAGFKGAVAPMGTALTEDQIVSLWKMIPGDEKVPLFCFDGDNAGRSAAGRAVERVLPLLKPGHSVRLAFLPDGEDPDTLIRKSGAPAFQKVLDSAMSLFDFMWLGQVTGRNMEAPETRAVVIKNLEDRIRGIADAEVQRHYKEMLRARISEAFFTRKSQGGAKPGIQPLKVRRPAFDPASLYPRVLLACVVNHPSVFEVYEEAIGSCPISDPALNNLRQEIIETLISRPGLENSALQHHLRQRGFEKELDDILSESVYVHASFCAPTAVFDDISERLGQWLKDMERRNAEEEMNAGWKRAFHNGSEEDEAALRGALQEKRSEAS